MDSSASFLPDNSADLQDSASLSRNIRKRARAEGFDKIGIVPPEALFRERERLMEWLARGYHGEMKWMARDAEKRTDPRKVFPQARSVVVLVLNYYTPHEHEEDLHTGKVSRYAWGDDYHEVMGAKLHALLSWVKQQLPYAEGKVCIDIQPMMDKAWAVRAGLGWIGKNSNLITPELGSWVFVGELLLNLELNYDATEIEDHCGSCTLCLDACPTEAITQPYVVDSTKCISYGTIELRAAEIPDEISENLAGWFYGCDICQDVCPWNRFAQATRESCFEPRPSTANVRLSEILKLTPETYAKRFRHSAIKRAKLSGLQRNAHALLRDRERDGELLG